MKVELADNVLTISGKKKAEKEEKNGRPLHCRTQLWLVRAINRASGWCGPGEHQGHPMAKGVLTLTVPKPAVDEPEAKKIEVKAAA